MAPAERPKAKLPQTARRAVAGVYPSKARPALPREAKRAAPDYGVPGDPDWRSVDWPAHTHRIEVAGRDINYVDIGDGVPEPVVFVHGLGGNWQNWLENIPCAAQDRRVIAMDLPGFGHSEMPAEDISISHYARLLDELLERLGVERAAIVGNSMGGFIGAEMAISHPGRVERLVLAAAAGISVTSLRRRPTLTLARTVTVTGAFITARSREIAARPRLRHLVLSTVFRHPTRLRPDLLIEVMQGTGAPGFLPALEALLSYDFRDRLPEIRCPVLLIWGEDDILVPVADADEYERLIPTVRKVVLDETGHVPMLERPREFNDCLLKFLAEERPQSGGRPSSNGAAPGRRRGAEDAAPAGDSGVVSS